MAKLKKRIHKDTIKLSESTATKKTTMTKATGSVKKAKINESGAKKSKVMMSKKKVDIYRPPAANEMRQLQEGHLQSHYNFLRLQADMFLKSIRRRHDHVRESVDKWLVSFDSFIQGLEQSEDKFDLSQTMPWLKKVTLPFDLPAGGLKGTFRFVPPKSSPFFIGSQTIDTTAPYENSVTVDVAVEMPKEFFQTADYLNFTYHYKKMLYMSYVLEFAKKSKIIKLASTNFTFLEDNPLQPAVVVKLGSNESSLEINIQLHFCMEPGVYKLNRFIPVRNNIRPLTVSPNLSDEKQTLLSTSPTYHYNNSILRDLVLKENQKLMESLVGKFESVSSALILLKYWLRRRNLHTVLTGHVLNMLMCHLIKTKKINPVAMSYYMIVRIFFSHFHLTPDDKQKELTLSDSSEGPTFAEFRQFSELSFVDATGFLNLFAGLTSSDMKRIIMESGKSIQMLDKSQTNAFQWLFMEEAPAPVVFDHLFHVEISAKCSKRLSKSEIDHLQKLMLFGVDGKHFISDRISRVLCEGLGNRIQLLQCLRSSNRCWSVLETRPDRDSKLTFGVILNPEFAFDVIVKGPQANDPAATYFREFWGEKSQLRRFKDGSVTEACVFGSSQDAPHEKRMVTARIVEHLLTVHLSFINGAKSTESIWNITYFADQLSCVLKPRKNQQVLDLESQALAVIREFNEIEMELRRLEGLPLEITGIMGVSPIFYYSDPNRNAPNGFCAQEENSNSVIYGEDYYDAVLTLSVSGRWPEDLQAIQRLKSAFYLEIGRRIRYIKGLFCRVAVDSIFILKNGYTFRFTLAHGKELQLMRQTTIYGGVIAYRDTPQSLAMEKELFIKPIVASALHGLHQQHNAFGATACLAKAWLNSQLLDSVQWPDACTELLVASLFMDDTKTVTSEVPVQSQCGFLRFLHLLANKNWETEFVLLNFNEGLNREKIDEIKSSFTMNRNQYPPVTIITSFDEKYGGIWAKEAPMLQVLVRGVMLARDLLKRLVQRVENGEQFSNESAFITQYTGYDAVIKLDVNHIQFIKTNVLQSTTRLPVDFDPIEIYLRELRSAYGDVALFFCNGITPQRIGVLWRPSVDVPRDFRISDVNSRYLSNNNQLVFDKEAVCKDFLLIGNGIAVSVE